MSLVRCPKCGAVFEGDAARLNKLSPTAFHVLSKLPERFRRGKPIPIRDLAQATGYSRTQVHRALLELVGAGYVESVPRGPSGQRASYRGKVEALVQR